MAVLTSLARRYLKVTKASQRKPWRVRQKKTPSATNRTPGEKKRLVENRRKGKETYNDALAEARKVIMDEAIKLRERFGAHSVDYYYESIIQTSCIKKSQRRRNRWNSFLHAELKKINDNLPPGARRFKAHEKTSEISILWKQMTSEEKIAATDGPMTELQEMRDSKANGLNNVPINAFHDTRVTLSSISEQLSALTNRTGMQSLLIAVRSDSDHYTRPFVYLSEDRVGDFFQHAFKASPTDVATRLEGYCIAGVNGIVQNYKEGLAGLKNETSALINEKLREAAQQSNIKMFYVNFDSHITSKTGVVIEGWPLPKFCSPGDINSVSELRVLNAAWKNGVAHFRRMDRVEWENWERREHQPVGSQTRMGSREGGNAGNDTANSQNINTSQGTDVNPATSSSTSVFSSNGLLVASTKKPRKARSDKGITRGPRKKKAAPGTTMGMPGTSVSTPGTSASTPAGVAIAPSH